MEIQLIFFETFLLYKHRLMDPILMQKFQAIKKSKKSKRQQLLDKFFLCTTIAFACSLLCSSPFWIPYLLSSMNDFLFISLPQLSSILYSPKLLFIVGNLIVAVLIGESKLLASASSLPGDVYYDEYVDRSRNLRNSPTMEVKTEKKIKPSEENVKTTCLVDEIRKVKKETKDLNGGNERVLPTEELKKRADDFIARVNRQRRLEARLQE